MSYPHTDTGTPLIVSIQNLDGTAYDLTLASAITLVGRVVGTDRAVSLLGSVYGSAVNGQAQFLPIGTLFNPEDLRRKSVTIEFRVKWMSGGLQYWSLSTFKREIEVFP